MQILDDYLSLAEAAKQCGKSIRTFQRLAQQRKIPVTYVGRTPFVHVPAFREVLKSRETKVVTERRGRR